MNLIADIAADIVTTINDANILPAGSDAVRRAVPSLDLEVSKTLQVPVITPDAKRVRQNRVQFRTDFTVQVGVLQLLDADDEGVAVADSDPLLDIVEGILDLSFGDVESAGREASFLVATAEPLYDADRLKRLHQFVSVISFGYVEIK